MKQEKLARDNVCKKVYGLLCLVLMGFLGGGLTLTCLMSPVHGVFCHAAILCDVGCYRRVLGWCLIP